MEVCKISSLGFENRFLWSFSIFSGARAHLCKNADRLAKASFFLHTYLLPYLPRIPWPPAILQKYLVITLHTFWPLTHYNKL
jgi:hypothetical protein